jgi:hypothetical protein
MPNVCRMDTIRISAFKPSLCLYTSCFGSRSLRIVATECRYLKFLKILFKVSENNHYFLVHFHNLALQSPEPVAKIPSVPFEFKDTATEMTELR